jgi:hypothetical protein
MVHLEGLERRHQQARAGLRLGLHWLVVGFALMWLWLTADRRKLWFDVESGVIRRDGRRRLPATGECTGAKNGDGAEQDK